MKVITNSLTATSSIIRSDNISYIITAVNLIRWQHMIANCGNSTMVDSSNTMLVDSSNIMIADSCKTMISDSCRYIMMVDNSMIADSSLIADSSMIADSNMIADSCILNMTVDICSHIMIVESNHSMVVITITAQR